MINFQEILDQYKGDLKFESMTGELNIDHETLYMIETDQGAYYVFETDYLDSFDDITDLLKRRTEHYTEFIEANTPIERFEDAPAAKYYTSPKHFPQDFEKFKKYIAFNGDYFIFLIKK
jgi:hypothetical protein